MIPLRPNKGKKLAILLNGKKYYRYPIKTHVVSRRDDVLKTVKRYILPHLCKGDIIIVSERIVAIMQGRSYNTKLINPSWWAKILSAFVYKHPGGIGLRSPFTMELAIREVGLWRVLMAAIVSVITKPFGFRGVFYQIAGGNINAIDGPTPYSLPPSDQSAKLPPKDPEGVARTIEKAVKEGVVIIDANDYGVNILGMSPKAKLSKLPFKIIFADNPMGQSREQTPIMIVRQ